MRRKNIYEIEEKLSGRKIASDLDVQTMCTMFKDVRYFVMGCASIFKLVE